MSDIKQSAPKTANHSARRHLEIFDPEQVQDHGVSEAELALQLGSFASHHFAHIPLIGHLPARPTKVSVQPLDKFAYLHILNCWCAKCVHSLHIHSCL